MKVIIIEDEKAAVRNLKALLQEVKPEVEVEATLTVLRLYWIGLPYTLCRT